MVVIGGEIGVSLIVSVEVPALSHELEMGYVNAIHMRNFDKFIGNSAMSIGDFAKLRICYGKS